MTSVFAQRKLLHGVEADARGLVDPPAQGIRRLGGAVVLHERPDGYEVLQAGVAHALLPAGLDGTGRGFRGGQATRPAPAP